MSSITVSSRLNDVNGVARLRVSQSVTSPRDEPVARRLVDWEYAIDVRDDADGGGGER